MDIYDKLIIVCIIFTILAILSIVFGCHYLTKKTEGFAVGSTMLNEFMNKLKNSEDFEIIEYMKKHKDSFKNEKFVGTIIKAIDDAYKKANSTKNTKANFKNSKKK